MSGLPSGARLELIFLSRSPSVIAVALQLPDSERQGPSDNRLVEKFPSSTTLWHILRRFESGPFGSSRNFTAKGAPKIDSDGTGAGRLYHEAPSIETMGREFSSFTDLQKTLAQLGFNTGSVAFRLKFHISDTPLEEAMEQIEGYFKSVENEDHEKDSPSKIIQPALNTSSASSPEKVTNLPEAEQESIPDLENSSSERQTQSNLPTEAEPITAGLNQPLISVIAPPKSSTPHAALQEWNEKDYVPSTEDALRHQARLSKSGRNQRLKADSEIVAEKKAQKEKASNVKEVEIKVRFPDQYCVVCKFSDVDTAISLYNFVKGLLENESEPFLLNFSATNGPKTIPREEVKLIGPDGLDMKGRLLVNVIWDQGASSQAREGKFLRADLKAQAKEIEIPQIQEKEIEGGQTHSSTPGPTQSGNGKGKGKGFPKWFKGKK